MAFAPGATTIWFSPRGPTPDVGRVDPLRLQGRDGALAIGVSPDQADHAHPDAGASGGDRLVGSLPTVLARETSAEHGLAG